MKLLNLCYLNNINFLEEFYDKIVRSCEQNDKGPDSSIIILPDKEEKQQFMVERFLLLRI